MSADRAQRIGWPGLDHAAGTEDHDLLAADALVQGEMIGVTAGRWHVLIVHGTDGFHALNDRCSHAASRLSTGRLRKGQIQCPLHGAHFDPASGRCVSSPYAAVRTFPARVESGRVIVTLPKGPPDMTEVPLN